jgi:phosphinothricin acetyltransferase
MDLTAGFWWNNSPVSALNIRPAAAHDATAVASIYAPYVEHTAISFEETPPTPVEMAARIEKCRTRWEWLVAEVAGSVVGYAYGSQHRERAAYQWSVEVSAYVDRNHQRKGIGRALYEVLLPALAEKGFCTACAGMTLPNEPSARLHAAMGFVPVGTFRSIGWKFGRWHDVAWCQRTLRERPPAQGGVRQPMP